MKTSAFPPFKKNTTQRNARWLSTCRDARFQTGGGRREGNPQCDMLLFPHISTHKGNAHEQRRATQRTRITRLRDGRKPGYHHRNHFRNQRPSENLPEYSGWRRGATKNPWAERMARSPNAVCAENCRTEGSERFKRSSSSNSNFQRAIREGGFGQVSLVVISVSLSRWREDRPSAFARNPYRTRCRSQKRARHKIAGVNRSILNSVAPLISAGTYLRYLGRVDLIGNCAQSAGESVFHNFCDLLLIKIIRNAHGKTNHYRSPLSRLDRNPAGRNRHNQPGTSKSNARRSAEHRRRSALRRDELSNRRARNISSSFSRSLAWRRSHTAHSALTRAARSSSTIAAGITISLLCNCVTGLSSFMAGGLSGFRLMLSGLDCKQRHEIKFVFACYNKSLRQAYGWASMPARNLVEIFNSGLRGFGNLLCRISSVFRYVSFSIHTQTIAKC